MVVILLECREEQLEQGLTVTSEEFIWKDYLLAGLAPSSYKIETVGGNLALQKRMEQVAGMKEVTDIYIAFDLVNKWKYAESSEGRQVVPHTGRKRGETLQSDLERVAKQLSAEYGVTFYMSNRRMLSFETLMLTLKLVGIIAQSKKPSTTRNIALSRYNILNPVLRGLPTDEMVMSALLSLTSSVTDLSKVTPEKIVSETLNDLLCSSKYFELSKGKIGNCWSHLCNTEAVQYCSFRKGKLQTYMCNQSAGMQRKLFMKDLGIESFRSLFTRIRMDD